MNYQEKLFSIQNLLYPSFSSNPDGISGDVFFKGCHTHCQGCHNLELQSFAPPNTSVDDIIQAIKQNDIHILTLMGGEPLDQDIDLIVYFIQSIKSEFPDIKVSLFTGKEMGEVPQNVRDCIDYLKTGKYDNTQLSKGDYFLASYNQKFYKKHNFEFIPYGT